MKFGKLERTTVLLVWRWVLFLPSFPVIYRARGAQSYSDCFNSNLYPSCHSFRCNKFVNNGGFSRDLLQWFDDGLRRSHEQLQKVVIFCHEPVYAPGNPISVAWNWISIFLLIEDSLRGAQETGWLIKELLCLRWPSFPMEADPYLLMIVRTLLMMRIVLRIRLIKSLSFSFTFIDLFSILWHLG